MSKVNEITNLLLSKPTICYEGIPVGIAVWGQIGKKYIYRIRTGNGYVGAPLGKKIQDKYAYFVNPSIRNTQGEPYRILLREAMFNWVNVLTAEQKAPYIKKAKQQGGIWPHNLYVKDYINKNK